MEEQSPVGSSPVLHLVGDDSGLHRTLCDRDLLTDQGEHDEALRVLVDVQVSKEQHTSVVERSPQLRQDVVVFQSLLGIETLDLRTNRRAQGPDLHL